MSEEKPSSGSVHKLVVKLGVLLMLLTFSGQAIAITCQEWETQGWQTFMECKANYDSEGQYYSSSCHFGDPPSPGQSTQMSCLETVFDNGRTGCIGSTCEW